MERSAVSTRTKRDSLLQEGLRRLRNMDGGSTNGEVKEVLGEFSHGLMVQDIQRELGGTYSREF